MPFVDNALNIYTDGSCLPRPRRGGIGIRFLLLNEEGYPEPFDLKLPGYRASTNNQMELQACIEALKEAPRVDPSAEKIAIHTDSRYIVDNYKKAMFQWPTNGWSLRDTGRPVENVDQWKELVRLIKKNGRVEFYWVKGHSKNEDNKAVDRLAKESAKIALNKPISPGDVRRKQTTKSVRVGSVRMRGQRISIRIITAQPMRSHGLFKYRYEVISKGSKYFGNVDFIFSDIMIKAGHSFVVSLNNHQYNPRISKVIREILREELT